MARQLGATAQVAYNPQVDGAWVEVDAAGSYQGFIAFCLVIALALMVRKAVLRERLDYYIGVCLTYCFLWLADPSAIVVWIVLALSVVAGYALEAIRRKDTPFVKRWYRTGTVAAYFLFAGVFLFRNDPYSGATLRIEKGRLAYHFDRLDVVFDEPVNSVTLLADRYRDVTTWVIRTAEPNVKQIRLDGKSVFRDGNGDELTGAELALRIAQWAGVEPIIKYDPLSIEQGPPGVGRIASR